MSQLQAPHIPEISQTYEPCDSGCVVVCAAVPEKQALWRQWRTAAQNAASATAGSLQEIIRLFLREGSSSSCPAQIHTLQSLGALLAIIPALESPWQRSGRANTTAARPWQGGPGSEALMPPQMPPIKATEGWGSLGLMLQSSIAENCIQGSIC